PARSGVERVVEAERAEAARHVEHLRVGGGADGGDDEIGIGCAPGEAGEGISIEVVEEAVRRLQGAANQSPAVAAIGGAQDAGAIQGSGRAVGTAGPGENHSGTARLTVTAPMLMEVS